MIFIFSIMYSSQITFTISNTDIIKKLHDRFDHEHEFELIDNKIIWKNWPNKTCGTKYIEWDKKMRTKVVAFGGAPAWENFEISRFCLASDSRWDEKPNKLVIKNPNNDTFPNRFPSNINVIIIGYVCHDYACRYFPPPILELFKTIYFRDASVTMDKYVTVKLRGWTFRPSSSYFEIYKGEFLYCYNRHNGIIIIEYKHNNNEFEFIYMDKLYAYMSHQLINPPTKDEELLMSSEFIQMFDHHGEFGLAFVFQRIISPATIAETINQTQKYLIKSAML